MSVVVERLYELPPRVIEDGLGLARFFFENDASSIGGGSYDAWVGAGPRDRFVLHHIEIVNRSLTLPWVVAEQPRLARLDIRVFGD